MFKRCPRQYYYRYMEDRVIPPKWIMCAGSAGHSTMEYNNTYKMEHGSDEKVSTLIEYFANEWDKQVEETEKILYEKVKPGEVVSKMKQPIQKYFSEGIFQDKIPTAVEKEFAIEFEGIDTTVVGTLDVEFGDEVYDYKFSQKKPSMQQLATSDQLKMYAVNKLIEDGKLPKKLGFPYLITTKTPQALIFEIPNIPSFVTNFVEDIKDYITTISGCVQSGIFPRNSSSYLCSPLACGYWEICRPNQKKIFFDLKDKYETKRR
jgi:hypothetical protein